MGKQDINEYDKSYHPPETIRLDYCAAVLAVVLKHHPDVSVKDLLDTKYPIPEDTPFSKKINRLKQNLVTIKQTSGCLSSHAYKITIPFAFSIR